MTRIAYDLSSFLWHNLLAGRDKENGVEVFFEDKTHWVNSAEYGYDRVVSQMLKVLETYGGVPNDMVIVAEGMNSKAKRILISNLYKARRQERPPEAYVEFEKLREMIERTFLDLGAIVMTQDYAEGDDTLAWLAKNTEEDLVIASYDNDLAALNGVNEYGAETETWIDGLTGVNKYGTFDHALIPVFKALVGDTSDNISGCPGFGPSAFDKFIAKYEFEGLEQVRDVLETGSLGWLHENAEECKILRKICDNEKAVVTSYELAKLRPEWVNTMKHPLRMQAGMVRQLRADDDLRLKQWYGRSRLVTIDNFEQAVTWALPIMLASPDITLDVETSSSDESDEWLARQGNPDGLDVMGSTLTGMGLTFGDNRQYSLYLSVDHAGTANIPKEKVRGLLEKLVEMQKKFIIHNDYFELVILWLEFGQEWKDNGFRGFLPNVRDSLYESSYVNENLPLGLKFRSSHHLGYKQVEYDEVTTLQGPIGTLPKGGKQLREWIEGEGEDPTHEARKYKMNELTARHVLAYGLDDTICTAALHNYFKLFMQLEHTYEVYKEVELDASYLHAQSFIKGVDISLETLNELVAIDDETYSKAWETVRAYLIAQGWEGTICPAYTKDITPAEVKQAFEIVTGRKLDTGIRTLSKLVTFCREVEDEPLFAGALEQLVAGEGEGFAGLVHRHFKGEPEIPVGSPKKMGHLMYDVMGLPVKVRNKVTDAARAQGQKLGTAKTDALAVAYAMQDATPEVKTVLQGLKLMQMVQTRRSLYYSTYPGFVHWKTGKVHSSHRQCATNTRRAASAKPNLQQQPKHPKIEGQEARFREVVVPHRKDAVVVSMDFEGQEMVIIAAQSGDEVLTSCYVGDNKRKMHTLTGLAISKLDKKSLESLQITKLDDKEWTYEYLESARKDPKHPEHAPASRCYDFGKKVNFTAEYGAMAPKVAQTLMVAETTAQQMLDGREDMFPRVAEWKVEEIKEAKRVGFVRTMKGAVRHLRDAFMGDKWTASKAERQSVNFKVQGSAAEQTKLAEGRMWRDGLFSEFDAVCYGPIHDEVVASVLIKDLVEVLPRMHACMVANYAGMSIPSVSTISFGRNFFRQIEIGGVPAKEAIEKGTAELYKQREERKAA